MRVEDHFSCACLVPADTCMGGSSISGTMPASEKLHSDNETLHAGCIHPAEQLVAGLLGVPTFLIDRVQGTSNANTVLCA